MDEDAIKVKVQKIMCQTDYTELLALDKLHECNGDEIQAIKQYLGIQPPSKPTQEIKSINQEIYKQLRYKLDSAMRTYNSKQDEKGM
jgi:predicted DNA-binding protein (UPF0278 family)